MDLVKQYIIQSIVAASNNLRLSSEKIEVVAMLKDLINKSADLENDIKKMKKLTEFSRLAIKLNEIYFYLTQTDINFLKISDKFKEHCQYLTKELSYMLDQVTPRTFGPTIAKMNSQSTEDTAKPEKPIDVDLSKRNAAGNALFEKVELEKAVNERIKESLLFDEEKEDMDYFRDNLESLILKPIKKADVFLRNIVTGDFSDKELVEFAGAIRHNGEMSQKIDLNIVADMHKIFAKALLLIKNKDLIPTHEIIEAMRACLIVIVALVRNKEVDITPYLNRAEEFGRKIYTLKVKD